MCSDGVKSKTRVLFQIGRWLFVYTWLEYYVYVFPSNWWFRNRTWDLVFLYPGHDEQPPGRNGDRRIMVLRLERDVVTSAARTYTGHAYESTAELRAAPSEEPTA